MGSHFHDWVDNGVVLQWVAHFRDFGGQKIQIGRDLKM